eukprot:scaffold44102_cov221-Amphora_coffeaeformis.AAC.2
MSVPQISPALTVRQTLVVVISYLCFLPSYLFALLVPVANEHALDHHRLDIDHPGSGVALLLVGGRKQKMVNFAAGQRASATSIPISGYVNASSN